MGSSRGHCSSSLSRLFIIVTWTVFVIGLSRRGYFSKNSIIASAHAYPQSSSSSSDNGADPIIPGDDISDADGSKHAADAIVSINGIPHYMLVGHDPVPAISRQFAKTPVTVHTAEILRAPQGFGCFLVNTPGYLRRAYAEKFPSETAVPTYDSRDRSNGRVVIEVLPQDEQESQADEAEESPAEPLAPFSFISSISPLFEKEGTRNRGAGSEGDGGDPVVSQPFFPKGSQLGSSSLATPFDDAIILTCFILPDSPSYETLEDENSPVEEERVDVLLAWLETSHTVGPLLLHGPQRNITPLLTMDMFVDTEAQSASAAYYSERNPRYHGYGALQYVPFRRYRGVLGERRVGEKYIGHGLTLERAAIVYDPSVPVTTDYTAAADLDDGVGAECLVMGKKDGERGDRSMEEYWLGDVKGALYMNRPLVGSFTDVNGMFCHEGRGAEEVDSENLDGDLR